MSSHMKLQLNFRVSLFCFGGFLGGVGVVFFPEVNNLLYYLMLPCMIKEANLTPLKYPTSSCPLCFPSDIS